MGLGGGDEDQGPQAVALARMHMFGATEDIKELQKQVSDVKRKIALDTKVAVEESVRHARAMMLLSPAAEGGGAEVRRRIRHLEVDRDEARARAARLAKERDSLLSAQATLEAELRRAQRTVAELTQRLRHRELDLRRLADPSSSEPAQEAAQVGAAAAGDAAGNSEVSLEPAAADRPPSPKDSQELPPAPPPSLQATLEAFTAGHCRTGAGMSKKQAIAALSSMQQQLQQEAAKRQRLEARSRKDQERIGGLFDLAQRQRAEIAAMRKRLGAVAGDDAEQGGSAPGSPFGGAPAQALAQAPLQRQASAPTRLPNVPAVQKKA